MERLWNIEFVRSPCLIEFVRFSVHVSLNCRPVLKNFPAARSFVGNTNSAISIGIWSEVYDTAWSIEAIDSLSPTPVTQHWQTFALRFWKLIFSNDSCQWFEISCDSEIFSNELWIFCRQNSFHQIHQSPDSSVLQIHQNLRKFPLAQNSSNNTWNVQLREQLPCQVRMASDGHWKFRDESDDEPDSPPIRNGWTYQKGNGRSRFDSERCQKCGC